MDGGLTSSPTARRRTAAWWWLLLVLVVAVLVTGTVVGLHMALPPTAPEPAPTSPPSPALQAGTSPPAQAPTRSRPEPGAPILVKAGDGPLLPGIGTGEVYASLL